VCGVRGSPCQRGFLEVLGGIVGRRSLASQTNEEELKKTCLYDFHVKNGGKMVNFAGFSMPVQYKEGIPTSHLHTRSDVSIFDVSHMLQTCIFGKDRLDFIESLIVGDIKGLEENQGTLSLFTNEKGGIKDDLIVTKTADYLYVVSNAGCIDKDLPHLQNNAAEWRSKGRDVTVEVLPHGLIALQGPAMVNCLQPLIDFQLEDLPFMTSTVGNLMGVDNCRITRCGYTGEDGVEISIPEEKTTEITEGLLNSKEANVLLAGLGARDSLRLEAGLCLYGNDIDETTTPVEGTLLWTIGKRRRAEANFPGASVILQQIKDKPTKKRVGFISNGPPARSGTAIYSESGEPIGQLTSGCPSPSLKQNVSMGYVKTPFVKAGTKVKFEIRKKMVDAQVAKMPFIPSQYYFKK